MKSKESSKEKAGHARKAKTLDPELIDYPRQTRDRCPMAQVRCARTWPDKASRSMGA